LRTIKLDNDKPVTEKAVVVKILQSKAVGDVIKIKNHIRHQHNIKSNRVYCDFKAVEVHVFGADYKAVRQAVDGFERGLSTSGHGGYRISFETEEREIDIEESIRKDERTKMKAHLEKKNVKQSELEGKWSDDRKSYEYSIERLKTIEKKQNRDIRDRDDRNEELTRERDEVQDELDTYHVPVHRIIWRRFKELVGRKG
jgi:hypothetical protein